MSRDRESNLAPCISDDTLDDDALLAHELAHTQQQRGSASARSDAGLEAHADRTAFGMLARIWGGVTRAPSLAPAHGGLRLQRCKSGSKLPAAAKGKVPDYDSFSDPAGNSALTDEQASAWAAMFQNPDQLDRVFADAANGNARAKQVVADLHRFFTATGETIAEIENRPDCLVPAWHELKGAVSDEGCMVDWSGLSYLRGDRPGGEALRTDIAKAYSRRSRELGIRNSVIANALTVFMVGWEAKAALAGEAEALQVRGSASGIPTNAASGEVDAVAKKTPEVTNGPKVIVDESAQPAPKPVVGTPPPTPATVIEAGEVGTYPETIKWGIQDKIPARKAGPGYWGKRTPQKDPRVDAYERKINPNNESYYLPHPEGGMVQFENAEKSVVQDGKLVLDRSNSFFLKFDLKKFKFMRDKILAEAKRQLAAANAAGLKVEWLVSDTEAVQRLQGLFKDEGLAIDVTYLPE